MSEYIKIGQKFTADKMNDIYEIIYIDPIENQVHIVMIGNITNMIYKVPYEEIKESFDERFYTPCNEEVHFVSVNSNGMNCNQCKEFFPYAESNQKDGSLKCYKCRNNL